MLLPCSINKLSGVSAAEISAHDLPVFTFCPHIKSLSSSVDSAFQVSESMTLHNIECGRLKLRVTS